MKPRCKLIDENGNIFNLMAIASQALKEAGMENESKEMISEVMASKDYFESIAVILQYVEIERNNTGY